MRAAQPAPLNRHLPPSRMALALHPAWAIAAVSPAVNPLVRKYSTLPKFGFGVCVGHPDPAKGAVVRRHEPRIGERWTRQRRAREAGAGRDEPRELQASCGRTALMRTAKSRGPGCRCYSQTLRRCAEPNRATRTINSRGDGDNRNSSPGRARHTPSNIAQGRPDDRLPCVSLVHCVCNVFARGSCGCQPAPGLPCALSLRGCEVISKTRAEAPRGGEGMSASHNLRHRRVGKAQACPRISCRKLNSVGTALRAFADPRHRVCRTHQHVPHECGEIASVRQKIPCRRSSAVP